MPTKFATSSVRWASCAKLGTSERKLFCSKSLLFSEYHTDLYSMQVDSHTYLYGMSPLLQLQLNRMTSLKTTCVIYETVL